MGKNIEKREILRGENISPGYAVGRVFLYEDVLSRDMHYYSINSGQVKTELKRIDDVFRKVIGDITKLEGNVRDEIGAKEAGIFEVHAEILKDRELLKEIEEEVEKELINAEHAVRNVFRKWVNRLKVSDNEAVKSKADDVEDLSRRVLCSFAGCGANLLERIARGTIVVAKRLLPSDTVRLNRKNIKGIVLEQGSGVSHSAIIARSMGVPALSDVKNAFKLMTKEEQIILDSLEGIVIRKPSGKDITRYRKMILSAKKEEELLIERSKHPAFTEKGKAVKVFANVASKEEVKAAIERGCDGIGLFRIEQVYMASRILPDEKRLLRDLKMILAPVKKEVVTLRLLDVGSDKTLPYLELEDEPDPVLGTRGVRLLLRYKNMLRTQIRAALILSKDYRLRLLIPFVTFSEEVREVRKIVRECADELRKESVIKAPVLKVGVMIETPAAVENIRKISMVSDFLSVGTNDLIQYALAAGRDNPGVAEYYHKGSRVALKYVKKVIRAAAKKEIECSVCGEMAGEAKWIKRFIGAGLNAVSVSPYRIPGIKDLIRKV